MVVSMHRNVSIGCEPVVKDFLMPKGSIWLLVCTEMSVLDVHLWLKVVFGC